MHISLLYLFLWGEWWSPPQLIVIKDTGLLKTILKWPNNVNMYFSKFKKKKKRQKGAGEFPGWMCILATLTPALNKWKHLFSLSKSYFCSFSFHPVFLILLFIYLKGRPSCSFSTNARSGLPCQLTIPEGFVSMPGMWKLRTRYWRHFSVCCPNGGDSYLLLCYSFHTSKPTKQVISTLVRSVGLSPHLPGPGLLAWKFVNIN